jgi:hypothetical protein
VDVRLTRHPGVQFGPHCDRLRRTAQQCVTGAPRALVPVQRKAPVVGIAEDLRLQMCGHHAYLLAGVERRQHRLQRTAAHRGEHAAVDIGNFGQSAGREVDPVVPLGDQEAGDDGDPDSSVVRLADRGVWQAAGGGRHEIRERLLAPDLLQARHVGSDARHRLREVRQLPGIEVLVRGPVGGAGQEQVLDVPGGDGQPCAPPCSNATGEGLSGRSRAQLLPPGHQPGNLGA